jgi:hypothetical protein
MWLAYIVLSLAMSLILCLDMDQQSPDKNKIILKRYTFWEKFWPHVGLYLIIVVVWPIFILALLYGKLKKL